jgi:hypothetical protein
MFSKSTSWAVFAVCLAVQTLWAANIGTGFSYQGFLENPPGTPVDDTCDFRFRLYDAASGGNLKGTNPQDKSAVAIDLGTFLISDLDFGASAFDGTARWLEMEVKCPSDAAFVPLTPRIALTPAVHALALPGLYTQQNATSPNLVGGFNGNSATAAAVGATIGGGGSSATPNKVTDNYGTVGGGEGNQAGDNTGTAADVPYATVAGGHSNRATGYIATIGGGDNNLADDSYTTIGGGQNNIATSTGCTVSGGMSNTASTVLSTIGGGRFNEASGDASVIGGGQDNVAAGGFGTVPGGNANQASGYAASVGGGENNTASTDRSTVGGGSDNTASGFGATVTGGYSNASSGNGTAVSGSSNIASADYATVPGGRSNQAGGTSSFAAGYKAKVRTPVQVGGGDTNGDEGTFVWGDSQAVDIYSTGPNQFVVRAAGGIWLGTNSTVSIPAGRFINTSTGGYLTTGGVWTNSSDRAKKENFVSIDPAEVLARVASMPIARWNYREESDEVQHIGPMAQDFHAAFGLGDSDKAIATVDADGVALSAIQGLYHLVQESGCQLAELRQERDNLSRHTRELEDRLRTLEALTAELGKRNRDQ